MPNTRVPHRLRWSRSRLVVAACGAVAVAVVAFLVVGPGEEPAGPRALTSDEANRLAITRYRNYEAGGRALTITVPTTGGGLVVTGSVDYRAGLGYAVVRGTGRDTSSDGLVQWNTTTVFVHPLADAPAEPPADPPGTGWHRRPLQPAGSALDSALAIALGLGSDRPDNAGLLPQNGAAWVGREEVGGRQVDVLSGPAARGRPGTAGNVRYWVDADGTTHRVRADVASEPEPVVLDFDARPYVPVRPAPGVAPTR
ncbi:hypothetical protein AB0I60_01485 [Actinosynnema sp. NPDC050436]|uniref:hypothetical protein n=1 Tax=Actinosynnema sp. NPDC050436 TaxID=3155659 RepID=UPI0034036D73